MYTIRFKIISIVLFFIACTVTALFIYAASATEKYKALRIEIYENLIASETEQINLIIAALERCAILYALDGKLYYGIQSDELARKSVVETLKVFPSAAGGGFWFEPYAFSKDQLRTGFFASRSRYTGEVQIDDSLDLEVFDYHNTNWYQRISENVLINNHVIWTKPYAADSEHLNFITTVGTGIFDDDGELLLISTVDWEIDEIVNHLMELKPTEHSSILFCVPEKDYIIYSTRTIGLSGTSISENVFWDINADRFVLNGISYLIFKRYMTNGWLLAIQIPENEIFAEIELQNKRFSLLLILSSIGILTLAFLIVSRFVNKPIKQLTQGVSKIALGNLDTQIEVSTKDELGHLAKVFNKMTKDLKTSIEENTREQAAKERMAVELGIAKTIQANMLPSVFPPFPDKKEFDIYASMVPAKEIGGDFYDFFLIDNDNLAIVIADVSGKGIPAALYMVNVKTLIKNSSPFVNPKEVFESVNNKLCENNDESMFVTAFMGIYNIPTGKFTYVNAGHNPPLVKKCGASFKFLETDPCIILGFLEDREYKDSTILMEDGDVLYLYTDGVTEAENQNSEFFGEERLLEAANKYANASTQELLHGIKLEVNNFSDKAEQTDDITMLALKITKGQHCENNKQEEHEIKFPNNAILGQPQITENKILLKAEQKNLHIIIDFVNSKLEKLNYSHDLINQINLVTEEIFINIAKYAYENEPGDVVLEIAEKENLILTFEDTGKPFNPLLESEPDLKSDLSEREIGGLGIYLVKKTMDKIEYSYCGGRNILVMTKNLPNL